MELSVSQNTSSLAVNDFLHLESYEPHLNVIEGGKNDVNLTAKVEELNNEAILFSGKITVSF
ncbi:hypothetical protein BN1013_01271 [Candidatus Rubidus massiliensis]|nr:hypothetical protein BN1013_01271 [Candidatus Rubidus massiliensis]